jgi:hypothetical protein
MTRFALTGKHSAVRCETCHTQPPNALKLAMECGSCHAKVDIHAGKLGANCQNCHDTNDWKTRVSFDHALTRFPLLGKHAAIQCSGCHADRSFSAKGVACADCHADTFHKQTLGTPSKCSTCHNSTNWKVWNFDHDTATEFTLSGRHKGLICSACHTRPGDPAKQSGKCIDCHRRADIHRGGFGEACEQCHVTTTFRDILMNAPRKN